MTTPAPIPKVARDATRWERPLVPFASARSAFRAFLERSTRGSRRRILLPAYIGWSPREGSGVFDPVQELALPAAFYRVDESLRVDLDHLQALLRAEPTAVVVLIHYFGYRDRDSEAIAALAAEHGALLLEDEAHAMLTDLVGGTAGRLGAACIYSLHKMLPVPTGGALVLNAAAPESLRSGWTPEPGIASPWDMDLARMAAARLANAACLERLLQPLRGRVDLLFERRAGDVPQTLPVVIREASHRSSVSRDELYERMNAAGFGVVSLYHSLVEPIARDDYPASHRLSRTVMNLPVHQEADESGLARLVEVLDRETAR